MTVSAGTRLGPYEIVAPLGKGGMGEVWKARDTRLGRDVALKISAEQFSERFEREARAIAALNHPNICHLYDVGPNYLVMELVEGPTLADRIKEGAIPLEEALKIAAQIADAVDAAHQKGVVHRDLKPGNIKIKPDGTIKVLDFGLAKMGGTPTVNADESPTLTIGQTEAGVILGTASYMSPEQAKGKVVDHRADIYAFGAVLYEMLTGQRLHRGDTTTDVLASVIKEEPQWDKVPAQLQKLLKRCLEKDPQKRLRHIGDVMVLVDDASTTKVSPPSAGAKWRWIAGVAAIVVIAAAAAVWFLRPAPDQPLLQTEINPPEGANFAGDLTPFALSPNGRKLVFQAQGKDGKRMLWLRPVESASATALAGTEGGEIPFWSPDSRWVGFSGNGKLQRIDVVDGGQPQTICDISGRAGGTWNRDGVIVFDRGTMPLQKVSAAGGTPVDLFPLDRARGETIHDAPYFLPDGQHFLYIGIGKQWAFKFASLDGKVNRVLVEPANGAVSYAPNPRGVGWLMYTVNGQLQARPFDPEKGEFLGQPSTIAEGVGLGRWWYASSNGILAYRHSYGAQYQLVWFGRDGKPLGSLGDPGQIFTPRISPDQKSIVFVRINGENADLWTDDLARNNATRFTFESGANNYPVWSPDGKDIIYESQRNGSFFAVERPASGIGQEVAIRSGGILFPNSISHDGKWLAFVESRGALQFEILLRSRDDPKKTVRIQERGTERDPSISPTLKSTCGRFRPGTAASGRYPTAAGSMRCGLLKAASCSMRRRITELW